MIVIDFIGLLCHIEMLTCLVPGAFSDEFKLELTYFSSGEQKFVQNFIFYIPFFQKLRLEYIR